MNLNFSPAKVLRYIHEYQPVLFEEAGHDWSGPFPFEIVLALLFYDLVVVHHNEGVARVITTARGATFLYNMWDDQQIVAACRRLRMETAGSLVMS